MLSITKIFHFEMAHAIYGYAGACKNIHGHSYELHVTVSAEGDETVYIPPPGFMADFKDIKKWVQAAVIEKMDHSLLLSPDFIAANPTVSSLKNLVIFEAEPTAENLLIQIRLILVKILPVNLKLIRLKLFETKDSYAEWIE
ncbi:MAG: 6-carboxytetrahydropterin synthase [Chitinophagaceae bacterium]|nr:6-carboxytetrahydropterin synthase [Chitinophagaceae bacterium]